ncbi:hypothetical protein LEP1GSC008_4624 [Leptospira kirschneri serovar Bulgarica str. Nikolaevo]|uniref:Uncharacterized protein n=1 Tax=Leptospira kirschneri serovar Bulgarica str. Nikolaevo TaxID=1240687 RepID=M6F4P2_9LEPT|nr:hypothetical protein LEP1GSC008_4624 [Leptospira kirschneri serovar Bulgarica str. Nikolaevo]
MAFTDLYQINRLNVYPKVSVNASSNVKAVETWKLKQNALSN